MKRILIRTLAILLLMVLFVQSSAFQWLKSVSVMYVYSNYEASKSVLKDKGIKIEIPGGMATDKEDWYPFVITFNDDSGFSWYIGEEARMTVLYNFGHFGPEDYHSSFYDIDSPYYNSFYGGYAVSLESGEAFAYDGGEPLIEAMVKIPEYDMKFLVQQAFGNRSPVMTYDVTDTGYRVLPDGNEWFYFDADMAVSGALHQYTRDYRSYIQYGRPTADELDVPDYEVRPMYGRIYSRYDAERGISLFLYCLVSDKAVIEEWEVDYNANTVIKYQ